MPEARHAFEFVEFVSAMIEAYRTNARNFVRESQLLRFQIVLGFPCSVEVFQKSTVRNFDFATLGKLLFVRTVRLPITSSKYCHTQSYQQIILNS